MMKKLPILLLLLMMLYLPSALADAMPRLTFKSGEFISYTGRDLWVNLDLNNPGDLAENEMIELRDEYGRVWSQTPFHRSYQMLSFKTECTEVHCGGFTVDAWYGNEKLTRQSAKVYVTDFAKKPWQVVPGVTDAISLTLDCCYDDKNTNAVLEVLDKYNVKITFFMAGIFVERFPESAKKILAAGHEIGNHSYSHPNMKTIPAANQFYQADHTIELMQQILDYTPRLFRYPTGAYDAPINALVRGLGMEPIQWEIDSHDWDAAFDHEKIVKRITGKVEPGYIILCHLDGRACAANLDKALDYYINTLGLQVIPVTELLARGGQDLPLSPYIEADREACAAIPLP